jgi:hypothetical protein
MPTYFSVPNKRAHQKATVYTWDDQCYRGFMMNLLQNLEPRREQPGTVIYRTLEEVDEIFFIEEGGVDIGFEINRDTKFILRLSKGAVIGAFNMTFNCKTIF